MFQLVTCNALQLIALFNGNASDVNNLSVLCRNCRRTIRESEQIDQEIYQPLVEELIMHKLGGNKKDLLSHCPSKSWFEILSEFYEEPFQYSQKVDLMSNSDFNTYLNCGGVTMIFAYEPCELIEIALKKQECKMIALHKFLFFISVLQTGLEEMRELPPLSVKLSSQGEFTNISYGKLLLKLLKNESNLNTYCEVRCDSSQEGESIRLDLFSSAKPKKIKLNASNDIFKLCEKPPYGISNMHLFSLSTIRNLIYGDFKSLESFDWQSHLDSAWSTFWKAGEEWWGCYAHSSFSHSKNLFIISFASASD